jgi:hypothetical protein
MAKKPQGGTANAANAKMRTSVHGPFSPGCMVVLTLGNPRDKYWGMILSLAPEGVGLGGIELASFEDLVVMVKEGEAYTPAVVFFPMHRIERIELDLPDGNLPSLSQRFFSKTGQQPAAIFGFPRLGQAPSEVPAAGSENRRLRLQKGSA